MLKIVSHFFDAEWSFANVKLIDKKPLQTLIFHPETKELFGLGDEGSLVVAKHDGKSLAVTNKESFTINLAKS